MLLHDLIRGSSKSCWLQAAAAAAAALLYEWRCEKPGSDWSWPTPPQSIYNPHSSPRRPELFLIWLRDFRSICFYSLIGYGWGADVILVFNRLTVPQEAEPCRRASQGSANQLPGVETSAPRCGPRLGLPVSPKAQNEQSGAENDQLALKKLSLEVLKGRSGERRGAASIGN